MVYGEFLKKVLFKTMLVYIINFPQIESVATRIVQYYMILGMERIIEMKLAETAKSRSGQVSNRGGTTCLSPAHRFVS